MEDSAYEIYKNDIETKLAKESITNNIPMCSGSIILDEASIEKIYDDFYSQVKFDNKTQTFRRSINFTIKSHYIEKGWFFNKYYIVSHSDHFGDRIIQLPKKHIIFIKI